MKINYRLLVPMFNVLSDKEERSGNIYPSDTSARDQKELSVENRRYLNLNLEPLTKVPITKPENLTSISPTEVSKCNLNIKYV